jgi:pilus assembly protein CpaE
MRALLAGDHEATLAQIRQVVLRDGLECPVSHLVRLDQAGERLAQVPVELVVVVLPEDPERALKALDILERLPRQQGSRVLAVGPAAETKLVLRALRGLVDDYLDQSDLEAELAAALGRYKASLLKQDELGRVIAVLAPSGGSGSSTLAVNLATVLAKQHKSALLLDLKLATGDLAALMDLKPTHSLADLCVNVNRMDRVLFERSLVQHQCGVRLLAPPLQINDIDHVSAEGVHKILQMGRSLFPYIVIDLDHDFRSEQREVLQQADLILVVLRLDFASLRNAKRTLDYLERAGIDQTKVRVVVNRYGQPKEVPFAKAEEALGLKIFHYVPDDPKAVNRANNNGVPVVIESPSARVARSVTKLAASVNGKHASHG